ncbi:probable inactive tRNA-specific adenosine deaminase-like protein 3 [Contarinia nasturtii]|uniref:probable inactive tRNA-specific adenosine deaminase-like protein 3 n=1 Tax=Contarinia nasturtii TaxID=265458 RepID=UPI0012D390A2|nr:probable inactive tRNA-specific adenosine deaminase-like protein 3 [Contarinia nasturtii]
METIVSKRIKLDLEPSDNNDGENVQISNNWRIKSILSDEHIEPIKRCFVYAGIVDDKKFIGKAMSELCQSMPLHGLNFLKRVHQSKLLLCTLNQMLDFLRENHEDEIVKKIFMTENDLRTASDQMTTSLLKLYMTKRGISLTVVNFLIKKIEITSVAAQAPLLSWQHSDVNNDWPTKFHPNKDLEKLYNGTWFTEQETIFHVQIMEMCGLLRTKLKREVCGIAIDPRTKSIVAIGFDEIDRHPLMHCAMVLIDAVARTQKGGAWNEFLVENDDLAIYTNFNDEFDEYTQSGVSKFIRKLITTENPSITFGAERVKTAVENRQNYTDIDVNGDNLSKYGPYLCTGYDVYLWREPCLMCSMALTHSRIRTIFFHETQSTGSLCTLTKLQSVKALNHHFQVFRIA